MLVFKEVEPEQPFQSGSGAATLVTSTFTELYRGIKNIVLSNCLLQLSLNSTVLNECMNISPDRYCNRISGSVKILPVLVYFKI